MLSHLPQTTDVSEAVVTNYYHIYEKQTRKKGWLQGEEGQCAQKGSDCKKQEIAQSEEKITAPSAPPSAEEVSIFYICMSGGSYDYAYNKAEDMAELEVVKEDAKNILEQLQKLLK